MNMYDKEILGSEICKVIARDQGSKLRQQNDSFKYAIVFSDYTYIYIYNLKFENKQFVCESEIIKNTLHDLEFNFGLLKAFVSNWQY